MKILMIIDCYVPIWGGTQSHLRQIVPHLVSLNCEVTILTRRWEKDMLPFEIIENISVYRVGWPGKNFISTIIYLLGLIKFVSKNKGHIDIIHTLGAAALGGFGKLLAIIIKKPSIARVATAGRIPKLQKNLFGWFILKLFKKTNAIICLSHEIDHELKSIKVPGEKIVNISNAVDTKRFCPFPESQRQNWKKQRGFSPDDPIVIFSGRIVHRKGLDVLLNAWPSVVETYTNARLIILGSGEAEYHAERTGKILKNKVIKEKNRNVIFEGVSQNPELYLGSSEIFVCPSRKEGLPNVLLEAMASGMGIIATDIGGNNDLIQNQKTGLLFPVDDSMALANAIKSLIDNPGMRERMGMEARKYTEEHHSFEKIANQYYNIYKSVVQLT